MTAGHDQDPNHKQDPLPGQSDHDSAEDWDDRPSKSELKRQMHALQQLGEELVNLPAKRLELIPMSAKLQEGVELARRLKQREARRRQLQYIGKVLRTEDLAVIQEKLDAFRNEGLLSRQQHHFAERWRDRIIDEGAAAIEALLEEHPQFDRQPLRQLQLQAQRERQREAPPAAARKLFRYLRDGLDEHPDDS